MGTIADEAKKCVEVMRKGGVILYPTDTVWGIGCDSTNAEAVKRVLGQWLIPADRVETAGAGIKHDAASYDEARVATTIEIVNE